jgi:ABC-type amino acid transport system permease subunit
MLVPIYLGICGVDVGGDGHAAAGQLMGQNIGTAFLVALVHTGAMTFAGAIVAVVIYLWLGIKFLSRTWFNLDIVWALSLVVVGAFGIASAIYGH